MPTVAELGIEVDAQDKGVEPLLSRINASIEEIDGKDVTVDVAARNVAAVQAELDEIESTLSGLDGDTAAVDIAVNGMEQALFDFNELTGEILEVDGLDPTIDVETRGVQEAITGIDELIAVAETAGATDPVVEVDAQVAAALAEFEVVSGVLDALDGRKAEIETEAQVDEALAELAMVEEALNRIDGDTAHADVDIDIAGALAKVEILKLAFADLKHEMNSIGDVDTRRAETSMQRLATIAQRSSTNISGVTTAVLALGPALVPILGVALAGVGALSTGFLAAGAGVGLFAGVAVSALSPVGDALKKLKTYQDQYNLAITDKQKETALQRMQALYESLDPPQRALVQSIQQLQTTWRGFVAQFRPEIFMMAAEGIRFINGEIPKMAPLMKGVTSALHDLERGAIAALQGPFWQTFMTNIGQIAGPVLGSLGRAFGNIITGIAGILNAFLPMTMQVTGGFESMTAKFRDWGVALADNPGFQKFIQYVQENTPKILALIGSLARAFVALIEAAAPVGGAVVAGVTALADGIVKIQDAAPGLLTVAIGLAGLGALFLNLVGPIVNLILFAGQLGEAWAVVSEAIAGLELTISGGAIATFLGWAAAIAAVVAGIVLAYQHFDNFRGAVDALGQKLLSIGKAIVDGVKPAIDAVVGFFQEQVAKVQQWVNDNRELLVGAWENIKAAVSNALTFIVNVISVALDIILGIWNAIWPGLKTVVEGVWNAIKGVLSGALDIILGIIKVFAGIITGDWSAVWDGLKQILSGAWSAIWGIISGAWQVIVGIFQAAGGLLSAAWGVVWGVLSSIASAAWGVITGIASAGWGMLTSAFSAGGSFLSGVWSAIWNGITSFLGTIWNGIVAIVQTNINLIVTIFSTIGSIISAIWGAIWTVLGPPVEAFAQIIGAILNGLMTLITTIFTGIRDVVVSIWNFMWAAVEGAISVAVAVIVGAAQLLWAGLNAIFQMISAGITAIWNALWAVFAEPVIAAWNFVSNAVSAGASIVMNYITNAWNFITNATSAAWNVISSSISNAWNVIKNYFTTGVSFIQNAWSAGWNAISSFASTAWSTIKSLVSAGIESVKTSVSNGISAALQFWRTGWTNFGTAVSGAVSTVMGYINDLVSSIWGAITGLASRMFNAGADLLRNLANGIRSGIEDAYNAMKGAVGKLTSLLPGSPAETGPLSGQGYVLLRGRRFMSDLARGLSDTTELQTRASDIANIMSMDFKGSASLGAVTPELANAYSGTVGSGGGVSVSVSITDGAVRVDASGNADAEDVAKAVEEALGGLAEQVRLSIERR